METPRNSPSDSGKGLTRMSSPVCLYEYCTVQYVYLGKSTALYSPIPKVSENPVAKAHKFGGYFWNWQAAQHNYHPIISSRIVLALPSCSYAPTQLANHRTNNERVQGHSNRIRYKEQTTILLCLIVHMILQLPHTYMNLAIEIIPPL